MKKLLTICLMLLGAVAQAQNFAITATTEAAIRKNIVKGNAANYGFGMINDTLKLVGLTTRNVIFTGSTSKTDIGLGNVDNTSDANKPVSTATQTALNLKANIANPTFTGTVSGITKAMVALGSVDNTTDLGKPVSTATQNALDLKLTATTASSTYLPISNPTATGTLTAPTIANSLGANFATTSGNVGIGTTTPSEKLEIYGGNYTNLKVLADTESTLYLSTKPIGGVASPNLLLYNSFGNVALSLQPTSSTRNDVIYYDNTDKETFFQTNNSTKLRIRGNGNVLIGTPTDAGYKLDVSGNARFNNSSSTGGIEIGQTGLTAKLQYNSNGNFDITPRSGYNTIFTAGNVGIGTTTPVAKLTVDGDISFTNFTTSLTVGRKIIWNTALGAYGVSSGYGHVLYDYDTGAGRTDLRLGFRQNTTNLTGNMVTFAGNGNVGIGTTTPNTSSILDVTSTTQGVLFPRMTTTQISAIASPADGLTVYNTTLKAICFYDAAAAIWKKVSHSNM